MDHESNSTASEAPDFAFAFNDSNFSDRILRIEIVAGPSEVKGEGEGSSPATIWAARHKKRRRECGATEVGDCKLGLEGESTMLEQVEGRDQVGVANQLDVEDDGPQECGDEEAVAMVEDPYSGSVMSPNSPEEDNTSVGASYWNLGSVPVLRTKVIHISSAILAAKSPFFYKLFSNGMRESEQKDAKLRICASEEAALLDLLQFMYSGKIQANTPATMLDVLMAADKFQVASCMRACSRKLRTMAMTIESALLYLDLPMAVLSPDAVQPLTEAARVFLAEKYKDFGRYVDEVMCLPLAGVEAVLSSDGLQIASEDAVYDFALKWVRSHYPKSEERREVLGSRLVSVIRFPMMSGRRLKKVLNCNDFDHELASKLVFEALSFRAEPPYRQKQLALEETSHRRFCERTYKYRPVKVVEFDSPYQQCLVFFDLKMDECKALWPQGRVYSQAFHLGGQGFFLSAHCNMDHLSLFPCFGLFLGMQGKGTVSFEVSYEFAARMKPGWEFVSKSKGNYLFTGGKAVGYRNLFALPWSQFMSENSPYFYEGVLHLRAELTIKPKAPA